MLIPENLFMALIAAFYMENCIFKQSTYNSITEKRESRDILDISSHLLPVTDFSLCQDPKNRLFNTYPNRGFHILRKFS